MPNKFLLCKKKAIRIINKAHYKSHTNHLFLNNRILKLPDLYHNQVANFMFDFSTDNLPSSFNNFFEGPPAHHYSTRNKPTKITREFSRTNFTANLPKNFFPKIWSKLK